MFFLIKTGFSEKQIPAILIVGNEVRVIKEQGKSNSVKGFQRNEFTYRAAPFLILFQSLLTTLIRME